MRAVLGHSFGGKVALHYAEARGQALTHAFFLDSMPGMRRDAHGSETTIDVIEILGRLPESRERDEQELLLQAALIGPSTANEGYASAQ